MTSAVEIDTTHDMTVHVITAGVSSKSDDMKKEITPTENVFILSKIEPMLEPNINRFVLFPIQHQDIWNAYKVHQQAIWKAEELDFSADKEDWETLAPGQKFFIKHVLAFFAG